MKAKAIVAYEKAIAKTLFTNEEDRDVQKRYNPTNMAQLKKLSKNIDLAQYLKAVGVETDEVILYEPRYFQALDQLINPQNLAVIKDYLLFRTLSDNAPYLNKEMDDVRFEFYGKN
ncbi:metallopeptidase [Actinobacillus equuli]|nr:metallopeptidase [Actinobacillus equuli]